MLDVTVFSCYSVVFLVVVPVVGWEPHSGRVACDLHPPRVSPGVVGWSVREEGFTRLPGVFLLVVLVPVPGGGGCVV